MKKQWICVHNRCGPRAAGGAFPTDNPSETSTCPARVPSIGDREYPQSYPPPFVDNGAPLFTAARGALCSATPISPVRRLDSGAENRLNAGFCDAAGDHVCASPGLARTVYAHKASAASGKRPDPRQCLRPRRTGPAAAGSKTEPESSAWPQQPRLNTKRLHCGSPMRTIRGGQGTPASAGARCRRI